MIEQKELEKVPQILLVWKYKGNDAIKKILLLRSILHHWEKPEKWNKPKEIGKYSAKREMF